jgi:precorrin isomerase
MSVRTIFVIDRQSVHAVSNAPLSRAIRMLDFMESGTAALNFSTNHAVCDTNMARASVTKSSNTTNRSPNIILYLLIVVQKIALYDELRERL